MKQYNFSISITSVGLGVVEANTKEEAIEKIKQQDWSDMFEEVGTYGDLIDIEDGIELD